MGLEDLPAWLQEEDKREARLAAWAQRLADYQSLLQAANTEQPEADAWRDIINLGEELLTGEADDLPGVNWSVLRQQVAGDYNTLGNALDNAGDAAGALTAFDRAVTLQPDFAMWRRNQASALLDLGRLDEAEAAIAAAREMEPDAPRLAQLEAQLTAARQKS